MALNCPVLGTPQERWEEPETPDENSAGILPRTCIDHIFCGGSVHQDHNDPKHARQSPTEQRHPKGAIAGSSRASQGERTKRTALLQDAEVRRALVFSLA